MKKSYVTLFALLSMMAVSCQKENFSDVTPLAANEVAEYSLRYSIDGNSYHALFHNQAERLAFIRQLMALAREGHHVSIADSNTSITSEIKEVVTFTTSSADEAAAWTYEMTLQGYKVDVQYDEKEGVYICTAIR